MLNKGHRKNAEMVLRLRANQRACDLAQKLNEVDAASDVHELDLTNCILADPDELSTHVGRCSGLQCLRCVACSLKPSDLFRLVLERLPRLAQVELSLVAKGSMDSEIRKVRQMFSQVQGSLAVNLLHMYAEVGGYENFVLLSLFLRFCPNLTNLHVHVVHGVFWNALLECRNILQEHVLLQTLTFTSDLPASIQLEPSAPFEFTNCGAICANVSHHRQSDSWSCTRLVDLAVGNLESLTLPPQLVVFAVHEANLTPDWIRLATSRHDWTLVRQFCLLLHPADSDSAAYPTAGGTYRESLREFFSTAIPHVVELNVGSFHFGADNDFTVLLQEGRLQSLKALCVPPCGLCHQSALRRLALSCPNLEDLDVRTYRRGSLVTCAACEGGFCTEPEEDTNESHTSSPFIRNKLARLTLSDVPRLISLWFLEHCRAVSLRLADCLSPMQCDYVRLGELLTDAWPRYLVLRLNALPFTERFIRDTLSRITSIQYLCIISAIPVAEDVAETCVRSLTVRLANLRCLHVHYRNATNSPEHRVTWMRQEGAVGGGVVVRDRPCFLCSTATFIGLIKPRNRDTFQTVLS